MIRQGTVIAHYPFWFLQTFLNEEVFFVSCISSFTCKDRVIFQTRGDTDLLTVLKRVVHKILPIQSWHVPFGKVLPWCAESMACFYVVNSYVHVQQNTVSVYIPNAIELFILQSVHLLYKYTIRINFCFIRSLRINF